MFQRALSPLPGSGGGDGFKEALFYCDGGSNPYTCTYIDSNSHWQITYNAVLTINVTDNEYMDVTTSGNTMTITAKKSGKYYVDSSSRWVSGYSRTEKNVSAGEVILAFTMSTNYNPCRAIYAV